MAIPVGDFLRAVVPTNWKWVRRLLELVRGTKISTGGVEIQLNQDPRVFPPGQSPLDSKPHQVEPPQRGRWPL